VINLLISFFISILLFSCEIERVKNIVKNQTEENPLTQNLYNNYVFYHLGDPYYIEGVKHMPIEDYEYEEIGLATFYGRELHNTKTANNDLNKVTELLGRHKTLPLPSIIKITNLENGLSLTIKINDRLNDNASLIQVSRKTAQLLKFYSNKITKVRIQILSEPSKQWKVVMHSMNEANFNDTIESAPTISVKVSNIVETEKINNNLSPQITEQPIELGFENIQNKDFFLKIYDFQSYDDAKGAIDELELTYKFIIQNDGTSYSLMMGPLENIEANNLVLSFISKGYKKNELILK
jgi:rare lipoprotein A